MTQRFKDFIPFIFDHECVYAKGHYGDLHYVIPEEVPGDAGGVTKFGCDYREFSNKPFFLTVDDIRSLSLEHATDLYWQNWQRYNVENLAYPLGEVWFNCKVVSGATQANKILERTDQDPVKFIIDQKRVNDLIIKAHPSYKKFLNGWNNRLDDLAKFVHIRI